MAATGSARQASFLYAAIEHRSSSISDAPLAVHSARISCLKWTVATTKVSLSFRFSRLGNTTLTFMTGNLTLHQRFISTDDGKP